MKRAGFLAAFGWAVVTAAAARALGAGEEGSGEDEEYRTVVTATGFEEEAFEAPRSIDVLDEDDFKLLKGRSTPELLSEVPGVFVQKTAHGQGAPIIRGLIGIHNLILFNGVRLNNSTWRTGPIQYLNLVDPFSIDRIEILKGPGSLLYGSDALGGVVSVWGASAPMGDRFDLIHEVAGKYSSADSSWAGHYTLGATTPRFSTLFGGSYKRFGDLEGGEGIGKQPFSGYREGDFDFNARVKVYPGGVLELGYYMVRLFDAGRTDALQTDKRLRYYDNHHDLLYARLLGFDGSRDLSYTLTLSYQKSTDISEDIRYKSLFDEVSRVTWDKVFVDTVGGGGQVRKSFLGGWLELSTGFDIYADFVDTASVRKEDGELTSVRGLFPTGSRYSTYELYALLRCNVLRALPGLHVWAGGRFTYTLASASDPKGVGSVVYSKPGGAGGAGVNYTYKHNLNAGVTFSEGFRSPKLSETTVFGDMAKAFEIPNPGLGPERADTLEVFAKTRWKIVEVHAAFYSTWFRGFMDKIPTTWEGQTEVNDKPVMRTENMDRAHLLGVEAALVLHLGELVRLPGLRLSGNVAWQEGDMEKCRDDAAGESVCQETPMSRVPPLFFTAVLGYYNDDGGLVDYAVEALVRGATKQDRLSAQDLKDPRIPAGGTPGWKALSLRGMVEFRQKFAVTAVFENILDEAYKIHGSGVYEPGRSFSLNFTLKM